MSNIKNNPMSNGSTVTEGEVRQIITAPNEFIRYIAEWLVDNYDSDSIFGEPESVYERKVNDQISDIMSNPIDVGIVFTCCMETDTDTWEEFGDEHEIQFSYDLCAMKWKLYLDNELIHEDDLDENKWGYLYGFGYDDLCGDLFDLCNEYAPLPDEHEYC